ncbi:MAG: ATP-binding protein [Nannocystaceae bacterium]|nr:ATP-binding protein [bacterium]
MEVSCRAWAFFQQAEAKGYVDLDQLLEGSSLERAVLERPTASVPWAEWRPMVERYAELVGGEDVAAQQAADLLLESKLGGSLSAFAMFIAGPADYIRLVIKRIAPSLFRFVEWRCTTLPDRRLEVSVEIRPPHEGSAVWMALARAGIRAIPQFVGAPAAACSGELGPRGGTLILTPPPDKSFLSKVRRWFFFWRGAAAISSELEFHQKALLDTERSLLESEAAMRAMVEALPDTLVLLDRELTVRRVHPGSDLGELATTVAAMQGKNISEALRDAGLGDPLQVRAALDHAKRALAAGAPHAFEYAEPLAGRELVLDVRLIPYGRERLLILVRDQTRQRELERQIAVTERMASMGQLAAGVAHEINNPLTVLSANLSEMQTSPLVEECQQSVGRITDVVRDLSRFSRTDPVELLELDICAVVDAAAAMARHELRHRAALKVDIDPGLPPIVTDQNRLVQVLVNVLVNAAHATEGSGGTIELSVQADDAHPDLVIRVDDDGPGIREDVLPRVFDPFVTTKAPGEGTGLGLSVCRTAITVLGGTIRAENRPSGGARFEIRLPIGQPEPTAPRRVRAAAPRDLTVLIVDDEVTVGRAVGRLLRGNEVVLVGSVAEAEKALADGLEPDVILCDLMMPTTTGAAWFDSLQGRDVLRRKFIFMTGGAVSAEARTFEERDDITRLLKPFRAHELWEAVAMKSTAGGETFVER